jgi:phage tail sheath protein FI
MPELLHPGVYVQELPSAVRPIEGVSTSTAAFIGVADKGSVPGTILPTGRMAQPPLVTSFTDYTRQFGGFRQDSFLTYAVRAFFENGGRRLYIVRVLGSSPTSPPTLASRAVSPGGAPLAISAANEGVWGNKISVQVANSSDGDTTNNFKLVVLYDSTPVEAFDNITFQGSPNVAPGATNPAEYGRMAVNSRSEYIAITADFTARPANTTIQLGNGSDGPAAQPSDFIGAPAPDSTVAGTGLHALDKITDVNLIALPGQGDPATVNAGMEYCKTRPLQDCFFIGDTGTVSSVDAARVEGAAPTVRRVSDARDFATTGFAGTPLDKAAGDYGAIYFPWVLSDDPFGVSRNPRILLPPSGFLAGLYARIDNSRGVFKAPAGTEAGVFGALGTAVGVSDTEQDQLNPVSVNVIRTVPGSGFVVWGTRTIGSDVSWRYIPVRRMAIFLRVSIYYGIQWAVFEPNDEPLWASLRLNIRSFMLTQFRAGAFQGSKPDDAFFVKCDSSTTTQTDIDNGVVNILVGFAPLKPAEFVVLKLSQKVNQPAV